MEFCSTDIWYVNFYDDVMKFSVQNVIVMLLWVYIHIGQAENLSRFLDWDFRLLLSWITNLYNYKTLCIL